MIEEERHLLSAVEILRQGGVVAFPTETVYGLGALVSHPKAVARIFEVKERPFFDPLIVHLASADQVHKVAFFEGACRRRFEILSDRFWPGPLTLILPKSDFVPAIVTSGLVTVGVRVPAHPLTQALLNELSEPLCAPSANKFGRLSPTNQDHVLDQLGHDIDFILDGGSCTVGIESTIVDITSEKVSVLRPGGIAVELIEDALKEPVGLQELSEKILAPGQLKSHYAPKTRLVIMKDGFSSNQPNIKRKGLLAFSEFRPGYAHVEILSKSKDLKEAAVNLFSCLHRLDKANLDLIEAETLPKQGLGLAIMNRLEKASDS